MVLGHSLRDNGTTKQLAVLVTLDTLSVSTLDELKTIYDHLIPVDHLVNKTPAKLHLMNRLDLVSTFTKIALWRQTQFEKIVYVDADMVSLRAPDELFQQSSNFAAVPDIGWPDCFNSGLLVLSPNMGDYYGLLALAQRGISFDGADQGLLNMHFPHWQRLSFTYNCTPSGNYQYVPAYRHFQSSINMVHFIGGEKPWNVGREWKGAGGVHEELLGRWWAVYDKHYRNIAVAYASGQSQTGSRTVQQYVKGEAADSSNYGYTSFPTGFPASGSRTETQFKSTEMSLREKMEPAEEINRGDSNPFSSNQRQDLSNTWDPSREPPPVNTRGEAANLVIQNVTSSNNRELFQPPTSYPPPPKNLGYDLPPPAPSNLDRPHIFPWEANQEKALRVFNDDPTPSSSKNSSSPVSGQNSHDESASPASPVTPTIQVSSPNPWSSLVFENAWDADPAIERFIRDHPLYKHTRRLEARYKEMSRPSSPTGLCANCSKSPSCSKCGSPLQGASPPDPSSNLQQQSQRRPSLRITDFPTAVERPSLPVTPAPVRRSTLWGSDVGGGGKSGDLPPADGVPNQADWDPQGKLAELQRKQAEMLDGGLEEPRSEIPDRDVPESSAPLLSSSAVAAASASAVVEQVDEAKVML
ncbi:MAG: hypothetical protein Q9222_006445 [Ikaeria aurantiellina]